MSRGPLDRRGVAAPAGFRCAAVAAGLKKGGRPDLAVVVSDRPAAAAGLFTRNQLAAAPVRISREHLSRSPVHRAILLNAGGANACTGRRGLADARALCAGLARGLGCRAREVLIASTGVIGTRLPVARMLSALPQAVRHLGKKNGLASARAIMTTDTLPKQASARLNVQGTEVRIGAMAKGSGMIHPHLATLLAAVTTDISLTAAEAGRFLRQACAGTFNAISVDGETSTNDTVLLLANGAAGSRSRPGSRSARRAFLDALTEVMDALARQIVLDGEGATKFIDIRLTGARSDAQAGLAARAVGDSQLVKTALYGQDANWGRILSALGAAPIRLRPDRLRVEVNGVPLVRRGQDAGTPWARQNRALAGREIRLEIHLGAGRGSARYRTCDLTPRYVAINAGYRS